MHDDAHGHSMRARFLLDVGFWPNAREDAQPPFPATVLTAHHGR
jgi:hypothetical protein